MKKFLFAAAALFTVSIYAATPVARYDFEYISSLDIKGKGKVEAVPGVKGKAVKITKTGRRNNKRNRKSLNNKNRNRKSLSNLKSRKFLYMSWSY